MSKFYCCNNGFDVRNVNIPNGKRAFAVEKGSFWYVDRRENPSMNKNNIVLSTNDIIIEITKEQLKNNFTDVS